MANINVEVVLASEAPGHKMQSYLDRYRRTFPALALSGISVSPRSPRTSRFDHLHAAFLNLDSDYVWFIDDDDFVFPNALKSIQRLLIPKQPIVIIGTSFVYEEEWRDGRLTNFELIKEYNSDKVFSVFNGENYVPICSMVIPLALAKQQLLTTSPSGEYLEDYFVLLRLLSAPIVEIETIKQPIAGISLRGNDNTVRERQRDKWHESYAAFIGQFVRHPSATNPLLWQIRRDYAC